MNARYKNPNNEPRGVRKSDNLSVGPAVENNIYEITTPSGRKVMPPKRYSWRLNKERFAEFDADIRIWFATRYLTRKSNDGVKYSRVAGQAEFDKF